MVLFDGNVENVEYMESIININTLATVSFFFDVSGVTEFQILTNAWNIKSIRLTKCVFSPSLKIVLL